MVERFLKVVSANSDLVDTQPLQPLGGRRKRLFDLALATAMLTLLAPIMLAVAALVRIVMGRPVIFVDQRVGFNGRAFERYNFRTMGADAYMASNPQVARERCETRELQSDPGGDCLGRLLRESGLDKLPQLFNVIRGDMSLVGPRPIVPEELAQYGPQAHLYLKARPGLTGAWRTSDQKRLSFAARVDRDSDYVLRWSMWLDVALLISSSRFRRY